MLPDVLAIGGLNKGSAELIEEPGIGKASKELGTGPIDLGGPGEIGLQALRIAPQGLHYLGDDLGQFLGRLAAFALSDSLLLVSLSLSLPSLFLLVGLGLLSSVQVPQERQNSQRVIHDIFDSILCYIFCSSGGGHFIFLLSFVLVRCSPALLDILYILLSLRFFCVSLCFPFLRICSHLITVLIVSYSRVGYRTKNPSLRVLFRIRFSISNRTLRNLRFFVRRL